MIFAYIESKYKIILAILLVSALLISVMFLQFTVDDSYITFRYARNLVEHGVWNWNVTGEHVEAYTNFLYAILAIIPEGLGVNTPVFFKGLSVVLVIYLFFRVNRLVPDKPIRLMALFVLLVNPYLFIHAYSGLETLLFAVLLFELVTFLSNAASMGSRKEKLFFLVLLLLPLTRPEGALFSLVALFLFVSKGRAIQSKACLLGAGLVATGYFVWRYQYFGYVFPNTFYIKSDIGFSAKRIIIYTILSFQYIGTALILLSSVKDRHFRALLGVSILVNIFLYGNSDLQMNYADRFPFQLIFPFLLVAFTLLKSRKASAMLFVLCVFMVGIMFGDKTQLLHIAEYYPRSIPTYAKLGTALSKYKDDNLTLMTHDAGMIPYFSEWHTYDSIGLANAHVAHEGFSMEYMREVKPDLVIAYSGTTDVNGVEKRGNFRKYVYPYMTECGEYDLVATIRWRANYYLLCFLNQNTPRFQEIKQSIQGVEKDARKFKISISDFIMQKYLVYPK